MIDGLTVLAGLADRIGQTVRCWSWTRSAALPPCVSMLGNLVLQEEGRRTERS